MSENLEVRQKEKGNAAIQQAEAMEITSHQSFELAGEWLRDLKTYVKRVQDYWKPLKDAAYKAWKEVCGKENAILKPLGEAETIVKRKMAEYQMEQEAKERALREELERRQREEAERLLKEAEKKEAEGDTFGADIALAQAEMMESAPPVATVQQPKAEGISTKKVWKARVIDESKVPVEVAGIVIRPVDLSALDKLAKASKGTAKIPGVEFYEDIVMSARGR
jgi:hypothetical protein